MRWPRELAAACAVLALAACGSGEGAGNEGNQAPAQANAPAPAVPERSIAEGLAGSRFLAAAQSAGLNETLSGRGEYTVLVPADPAFDRLPADLNQGQLQPAARARLAALLSHHILPGSMLVADIRTAIGRGGGKTMLATMAGGPLTATLEGDRILLTDEAGGRAMLTGGDERFSNGTVHRIDALLLPADGG